MLYHARRAMADLRPFRPWVPVLMVTGFTMAFVSAVAAGGLTDLASAGGLGPSRPEALSYLRVLDADEAPTTTVESVEELKASTLDEPGLAVLMDEMDRDDRLFIVLYLQSLTNSYVYGGTVESGVAVIGSAPSWLPADGASADAVLLWGEMPPGAPSVDDAHFGELPVQRMGAANPRASWAGVHRIAYRPGSDAVVLFRPDLARRAGVDLTTTRVADVLSGLTCECEVGELEPVAAAMTQAERAAGTRRLYYAVAEEDSLGPFVRSTEAVLGLTAVALAAIAVGVLLFAHVAAVAFWDRSRRHYRIEHRAGARLASLATRQQATLLLVVTGPVLTGVWLQDVLLGQGASSPTPWHGRLWLGALIVGVVVQTMVGLRPFLGLRRECRPLTRGGGDA